MCESSVIATAANSWPSLLDLFVLQATEGNDVDATEAPAAADDALAAVSSSGGLSVALGGTAQATSAPPTPVPAAPAAVLVPEPAKPAVAKAPAIDLLGDDLIGNGELHNCIIQ